MSIWVLIVVALLGVDFKDTKVTLVSVHQDQKSCGVAQQDFTKGLKNNPWVDQTIPVEIFCKKIIVTEKSDSRKSN